MVRQLVIVGLGTFKECFDAFFNNNFSLCHPFVTGHTPFKARHVAIHPSNLFRAPSRNLVVVIHAVAVYQFFQFRADAFDDLQVVRFATARCAQRRWFTTVGSWSTCLRSSSL